MRIGIRELVCILVVLGIPPAFWWSVYRPIDERIAAVNNEYETKKQKLEQLEAAMKPIDDLGREIDRLSEALTVFEAKLPAEKEVEVILKEVTQVAMRHGLKTRSVRAEKPTKNTRYSEQELKMVIRGDFDGYYSFLIDVERLSRITQVPQMKLSKFKGGEEGEMEAEFTLKIFFEAQGGGSDRIALVR
jgi:type IV pilus assembly protein PilO